MNILHGIADWLTSGALTRAELSAKENWTSAQHHWALADDRAKQINEISARIVKDAKSAADDRRAAAALKDQVRQELSELIYDGQTPQMTKRLREIRALLKG